MSEIILHHYPQSPVAEKVRISLGVKQCQWRSVQIPRIPPKPDLIALTGGYRRTPVLQIGADIYCDSQCILRELENRVPQPGLFPQGGAGTGWGLSRWFDQILFPLSISIVIGHKVNELDEDFLNDRANLYFGPDWTRESIFASVPDSVVQLFSQLAWLNNQLAHGDRFLAGDQPGLVDIEAYYVIWFVRSRYNRGSELLDKLQFLANWEQAMQLIGHGTATGLSSTEALNIALRSTPVEFTEGISGAGFQQVRAGERVTVVPDGVGDDPAVEGNLLFVNAEEIAISRSDLRVGDVVVHFPAVGYRLSRY